MFQRRVKQFYHSLLGLDRSSVLRKIRSFQPALETSSRLDPSEMMLKAILLLQAGRGEEAVFWFYADNCVGASGSALAQIRIQPSDPQHFPCFYGQ